MHGGIRKISYFNSIILDWVSLVYPGSKHFLTLIFDSDNKAVILFKATPTICDYLKGCDEKDLPKMY